MSRRYPFQPIDRSRKIYPIGEGPKPTPTTVDEVIDYGAMDGVVLAGGVISDICQRIKALEET